MAPEPAFPPRQMMDFTVPDGTPTAKGFMFDGT
jgi:hypothetical protein